jgi:hypothetical protein
VSKFILVVALLLEPAAVLLVLTATPTLRVSKSTTRKRVCKRAVEHAELEPGAVRQAIETQRTLNQANSAGRVRGVRPDRRGLPTCICRSKGIHTRCIG